MRETSTVESEGSCSSTPTSSTCPPGSWLATNRHGCSRPLAQGYSGLRWGEVVALDWENVDMARRRIHVKAAATEISGPSRVGDTQDSRGAQLPSTCLSSTTRAPRATGSSSPHPRAGRFDTPTSPATSGAGMRSVRDARGAADRRPQRHRSVPSDLRRRLDQSPTADAGPRLRRDDPRHLRFAVHRIAKILPTGWRLDTGQVEIGTTFTASLDGAGAKRSKPCVS